MLTTGSASQQREALLATVDTVTVHRDRIEVQFADNYATPDLATLTIPAAIVRAGKQVRIATPPSANDDAHPNPALIKLVVKAHMARQAVEDHQDRTLDAIAEAAGYTRNYFAMLLRIGFLAPDITAAILDGRQPAGLTRQRLARVGELPLAWDAQRALLGFSAAI
jgi:site-specific DNA recombinase